MTPNMTKSKVAKLMDAYLAEVARDANLPLARFQNLAESLPQFSRATDDGLYKAVDTYLKACPYFELFLLKIQKHESALVEKIRVSFRTLLNVRLWSSHRTKARLSSITSSQRESDGCMFLILKLNV